MPIDNLTQEQIFVGKMQRVAKYTESLNGRSFGIKQEGGRNRMAKVVVFNVIFSNLVEILKKSTDPLTKKEISEIIIRLDFLIDLSNTTDESWECFWTGGHIFKPEDYTITELRNGETVAETLFDVEKITIRFK